MFEAFSWLHLNHFLFLLQDNCARVLLVRGANKEVKNYNSQSPFQVETLVSTHLHVSDYSGSISAFSVGKTFLVAAHFLRLICYHGNSATWTRSAERGESKRLSGQHYVSIKQYLEEN